jgi:murein DD-endopeptidase MepM/ murein hydrolase activator NlpD
VPPRVRLLPKLLALLVILAIAGGVAWFLAGRQAGPSIALSKPDKFVGPGSTLEMQIGSPGGELTRVEVTLEQNGAAHQVYALDQRMAAPATASQKPAETLYVMRGIGKEVASLLKPGPARIVVVAARPVLFGLREVETTETRDVQVRLEPPRVAVLSTFHYINHGGSEFVVYRATPEDVESGVRVGDIEYRGYPAKHAGIATADPALRVAFFALLYDQPRDAPIQVFARDAAGGLAMTPLDRQVFQKPYGKSRIEIDDGFIGRVVPAIAASSPSEGIPTDDALAGFLKINGELRRKNNGYLLELAKKSAPEMMFKDAFQQLGNSQVEAKFADARTYVYKGKEVDQQVHLGFDLAVTAHAPIAAAQRGVVVHAADLGIYGNCVVIDHGLGVQSLYGHLSSIDVKAGQTVDKGQALGKSGMTGLAGGDHLHFTMLVGGQQVTPVDWWSVQWMQDRVLRKIAAAAAP